jgi:peptidoglycan hydrolase CwlO-like protein
MTQAESGVALIKKKVQSLKNELDECQCRATEAEEQLVEKETLIEKVCVQICFYCFSSSLFVFLSVCLSI